MKSGVQRDPYLDEIIGPESFEGDYSRRFCKTSILDCNKFYSLEGILHLVNAGVMEIAIRCREQNRLIPVSYDSLEQLFIDRNYVVHNLQWIHFAI